MRSGITISVSAADRRRLEAIVADRNTSRKHAWRARIILLTSDGIGTTGVMTSAGKSKTTVWRWQARLAQAGVDGLLVDLTRPPGKAPVADERVAKLVQLTHEPPPHEATHWTARAMAKAAGLGVATMQKIWKAHGLAPHRWRAFKLSRDPASPRNFMISSGSMSVRRRMPWCSASTRKAGSRRSTGRSRACR
jgi:transposase